LPGVAIPRRRPAVIALVGIDGSGKTTQARLLAGALSAAGAPATYWQNAGGRRWFGRLARKLGRRDGQRLLGRRGLLVAESILRWLAIARALVRSWLRGRIAVMDRYAVCQYASIRAHGKHGPGGRPPAYRRLTSLRFGERAARLAYRVFPAPDITFFLVVDPGEAYQRIEARGTDHEDIGYLSAAQAAYRALPEGSRFIEIDAGGTPDEVARLIAAHLPALAPCALPVAAPVQRRQVKPGIAQARP
jgi:thymidylate kinase